MNRMPGIEKKLRRLRFSDFSEAIGTILSMLLEKPDVKNAAESAARTEDEPLPATLKFVFGLGISFVVLWFGMYLLLRARW